MASDLSFRIAAGLFAFNGLGFGIPAIMGIKSLAEGRGMLIMMGFPAYGAGPLERAGVPSTPLLLSAFLLVCALECVAAVGVWNSQKWAAILGLALLVPGAFFWWGFALPIPPVFAAVRTVLTLANWSKLS